MRREQQEAGNRRPVLRSFGVSVKGMRHTADGRSSEVGAQRTEVGFSLVEVTVALGIFAFVAVGILGLLPAALKSSETSSTETRAVMIAEELISSVRAAPSLTEVVIRDGPAGELRNNQEANLAAGDILLLGYVAQTSVPLFLWGGDRNVGDPRQAWETGVMPQGALDNLITTMALISARPVPNQVGLYQLDVQVRPASGLALERDMPVSFSTYVYSP